MSKISFYFLILFLQFFPVTNAKAQPKYEFRAVWIATVDNIDWPSNGNYDPGLQKAEFIRLLDMHRNNGINAVIVQVRPATDAFYPSQYEPWSQWLTGQQGKPPSPYYDPLEFMLTETHKRGMEFHAWMNPYRAEFSIGRSSISPTHITRIHPEWFISYGGKRYFDPGNKEVQFFVTNVVRDVVSRYDIDAIHFDDYFYPYRIPKLEFPDYSSYSRFGKGLSKDDWRRSNVDSIILNLSRVIKKENPYCKFGISPFGVWRNMSQDPRGSNTKGGQTNYDDLYADILLWSKNRWIDYVIPQLYWEFSHKLVGYGVLLDWWAKNGFGVHTYIGHGIYRATEHRNAAWKNDNELPYQIQALRKYSTVQGSAFYSSKSFNNNPNGWNDSLRNNYYRYPAIVPPMPWIDSVKPARPIVEKLGDGSLKITTDPNSGIRFIMVYCAGNGIVNINDATSIIKAIPAPNGDTRFNLSTNKIQCNASLGFTVVSKTNVESEATIFAR